MYQDGEVLGLDTDGCVLQWNADNETIYNCGETLAEFGVGNLTTSELERITKEQDDDRNRS